MAGKRSGRARIARLGVDRLEPRTVLSAASFVDTGIVDTGIQDAIPDSQAEHVPLPYLSVRCSALHDEILALRPRGSNRPDQADMSTSGFLLTPAAIDALLAEEAEVGLAAPALAAAALAAKTDTARQQSATDLCLAADADPDALNGRFCATCDTPAHRWRWYDPLWVIAVTGGAVSAQRLARRRKKNSAAAVKEFESLA